MKFLLRRHWKRSRPSEQPCEWGCWIWCCRNFKESAFASIEMTGRSLYICRPESMEHASDFCPMV